MLDATITRTDEDPTWERWLAPTGHAILRYGLAALLLGIGAMKFFAFEAEAIRPLLEHNPLTAWLIPTLGLRGASAAIGVTEIVIALMIVSRPWLPRVSGYGSLLAATTFVVTLSFLATTPQPPTGFLLKDLVLLGAALYSAGEAFAAARRA